MKNDDDQPKKPSRVQRRAIENSMAIALEPPKEIAYQHTVFCQTVLPYRNPGKDVRVWEKQQGNVGLRIEAGAAQLPNKPQWVELPLPSGPKARLILYYLNAEAIKQQSPVIEVQDSLTAFVRRLQRRAPNGPEIRKFKDQLSALAAATIRFGFTLEDRAITIKRDIVKGFEL